MHCARALGDWASVQKHRVHCEVDENPVSSSEIDAAVRAADYWTYDRTERLQWAPDFIFLEAIGLASTKIVALVPLKLELVGDPIFGKILISYHIHPYISIYISIQKYTHYLFVHK
jgi:hypothetical protein